MIKLYGAVWCPDCQRVKKFFGERDLAYEWIDIDKDAAAALEVERRNQGRRIIPVIVFEDGSSLVEPADQELAEKLKISGGKTHNYHDLIVVGGGPTGLTTAIYTTREGVHTAIVEGKSLGGQASITDVIDNYPGFPKGVNGFELSQNMVEQVKKFGAEIISDEVKSLKEFGFYKKIETVSGQEITARVILIATGTEYKRLNVPGEKDLIGKGIHFCATCDGPFYKNKELVVVGGGNSALQEGIFLTRFAAKIKMVVRGEALSGSKILQDNVENDPKFEIIYNSETKSVEKRAGRIVLHIVNLKTGGEQEVEADGAFIFIGLKPNTEWLEGTEIEVDERGFIKTDKSFETNIRGVFAAGDVRAGSTMQIASAVGEGATAALMIREFLKLNR